MSFEYLGVLKKYTWKCGDNHIWKAAWHDVRRGSWCHECSHRKVWKDNKKYKLKDLEQLAAKFNGEFLSDNYISSRTKYKWKCEKGHTWLALIGTVETGSWCKTCEAYDKLIKLGDSSNLKCLSKDFYGRYFKYEWLCKKGHHFKKSYSSLVSTPYCIECKQKENNEIKLSTIKDIVTNKGGKCLSSDYNVNYKKLKFECGKGHVWKTTAKSIKDDGTWCPKCVNNDSKAEKEILKFISNYKKASKINLKDIGIDSKYEIDIYIPDLRLGIEYCGIYWHSEKYKDKNYHYKKYKICKDNGIRLITIFEDEWKDRNLQIKNFLKSALGANKNKIAGRKCEIKIIDSKTAKDFINKYHIQKANSVLLSVGLFFEEELLGVIAGNRHHRKSNKNIMVLSRLVFKDNYTVQGGASKLFKYFKQEVKNLNMNKIITWADNRYTEGNIYKKLDMKLEDNLRPDYSYADLNKLKRLSKQSCNKKRLSKLGAIGSTEHEMAQSLNLYRIYDCGKTRFGVIIK